MESSLIDAPALESLADAADETGVIWTRRRGSGSRPKPTRSIGAFNDDVRARVGAGRTVAVALLYLDGYHDLLRRLLAGGGEGRVGTDLKITHLIVDTVCEHTAAFAVAPTPRGRDFVVLASLLDVGEMTARVNGARAVLRGRVVDGVEVPTLSGAVIDSDAELPNPQLGMVFYAERRARNLAWETGDAVLMCSQRFDQAEYCNE